MPKKEKLIIVNNDRVEITSNTKQRTIQKATETAEKTKRQILDGLSRPTASTGTPMKNLAGAARITATLSNIGNGSKESGGDGMRGGMETITEFAKARGVLSMAANETPLELEDPLTDK